MLNIYKYMKVYMIMPITEAGFETEWEMKNNPDLINNKMNMVGDIIIAAGHVLALECFQT